MATIIKNDLFKIGCYFLFTIILGAVLAPVIFHAGKGIVAWGVLADSSFSPLRELHRIMHETNFQRYFNRAILVAALICLVPVIKWLGIGDRSAFGLRPDAARWRHLGTGFVLAAGLLLLMGLAYVLLGVFEVRDAEDRKTVAAILRTAVISGVAVALIEEFLFRGMMLGICLRATSRLPALVFVTSVFAAVHFLKPPDSISVAAEDVGWSTGFWMMGRIFAQFGNPIFLLSEFATLFAVGWVLGIARLRTGSLWCSIGLHAGWVFGLKTFSALTKRAMSLEETLPWVGKDLKNGLVSLAVVAITGVIIRLWLVKPAGDSPPAA